MSKKKVYKFNGCAITIKEVKWFDNPNDKKKGSYVSTKAIESIIPGRGMLELINNPVQVPVIKGKFTMDDLTEIVKDIYSKQDNAIGIPFVLTFPEKW